MQETRTEKKTIDINELIEQTKAKFSVDIKSDADFIALLNNEVQRYELQRYEVTGKVDADKYNELIQTALNSHHKLSPYFSHRLNEYQATELRNANQFLSHTNSRPYTQTIQQKPYYDPTTGSSVLPLHLRKPKDEERQVFLHIWKGLDEFIKQHGRDDKVAIAEKVKELFVKEWKDNSHVMVKWFYTPEYVEHMQQLALWALDNGEKLPGETINTIMFPGLNNVKEIASVQESNRKQDIDFRNAFLHIHDGEEGAIYRADNLLAVASDVETYGRVVDHEGNPILNHEEISKRLQKEPLTRAKVEKVLSEEFKLKEKYGEPSGEITKESLQLLFELAVTGTSAAAERPDEPGQKTEDNDAFNNFAIALDDLKVSDEKTWYHLTHTKLSGKGLRTLQEDMPGIISAATCLGTYKRDLAQFLYEKTNLDEYSKERLKGQYLERSEHGYTSIDWQISNKLDLISPQQAPFTTTMQSTAKVSEKDEEIMVAPQVQATNVQKQHVLKDNLEVITHRKQEKEEPKNKKSDNCSLQ